MVHVYSVTAVLPRFARAAKHTCTTHLVLAQDEAQALEATKRVRGSAQGVQYLVELHKSGPEGEPLVLATIGHTLRTPQEVAKLLGQPAPAAPPAPKAPALSTKRLGVVQFQVLRSFQRGPFPHGGWVWETSSRTRAIAEALYQRNLLDKVRDKLIGEQFSLNAAGRQALEDPMLVPLKSVD